MNDDGCLLYLISPPFIGDVSAFAEELALALETGKKQIGALQLRLKDNAPAGEQQRLTEAPATPEVILRTAEVLRPLCANYGVAFIMNDSVEMAGACGADGVHLGQEDGDVAEARAVLGEEAIIGVSAHASRHLAMEAGEAGADYVAFGAFYPTTSKSPAALAHWGTPTPEILSWWSTETILPCVAIGGITPANAAPLVAAGADFIAVLSGVWSDPRGVAAAVQDYCSVLTHTQRLENAS